MVYIKAILKLCNGENEKEVIIQSDINITDLEREIIEEASLFADENNAYLPLDYVADWMEPCFDTEEECDYVYYQFIDSNYYNENSFSTMWDNYMKALGRGR